MVWGGNRYVVIFVGGGDPKKVPQMGKKTADSPPPHMVKNVPNIE